MSDQPGPIARLMEIDARESALLRRRGEVRSLAEKVIAALPDALVVIDREGAILVFNAAAELMFGYAEAEMIGQPIEQLMPAGFARCTFATAPSMRVPGAPNASSPWESGWA